MVSQRRSGLPPERKALKSVPDSRHAESGAVRLNLRRRQRIALLNDVPEHLFVVEDGCLTLDAVLHDNRRQVALVLYPGDLIKRSAAPPVPQIGLTALRPSIVLRLREGEHGDGAHEQSRADAFAALAARSSLHAIAIGRLTGEERLATLVIEMALRLGQPTPGGQTLEMPLSRNDMADYLALNPDTLSRMMSRMRSRGILAMPTRSRLIIREFETLASMTPLAEALQEIFGQQPAHTTIPAPARTEDTPC